MDAAEYVEKIESIISQLTGDPSISDEEIDEEVVISLDDSADNVTEVFPEEGETSIFTAKVTIGDSSEELESPVILEEPIVDISEVIAIDDNETEYDITDSVIFTAGERAVQFDDTQGYVVLKILYTYTPDNTDIFSDPVLDGFDEENPSQIQEQSSIAFTEESRDQLEYLYSLFEGMDRSQIESLASDLEQATVGEAEIDLTDSSERNAFLERIDSLVTDPEAVAEEADALSDILDASFAKDIKDYGYLLPTSIIDIKSNLIDALSSDIDEEDYETLEGYVDSAAETVSDILTVDNVDEFIDSFTEEASSLLDTEQMDTAVVTIENVVYNTANERDIRAEIIRTDLVNYLEDEKAVEAALPYIYEASDNTGYGVQVAVNLRERISQDDFPIGSLSATVDEIIDIFETAIETTDGYLASDNVDEVFNAFVTGLGSDADILSAERVEDSDEIVNGGDPMTSPIAFKEYLEDLLEVSAVRTTGVREDITDTSSIENGKLILPEEDVYVYIYASYETNWLEYIFNFIRREAIDEDGYFSMTNIKGQIVGAIQEYKVLRQLTPGEAEVLKKALLEALGDELSLNTITAKLGKFERIIAQVITTDQLYAAKAVIREATIDKLYVNTLNAKLAIIEQAVIDYADIHFADIDFANVDTAEIGQAWIQDLFVQGGIVARDGSFLNLTGVRINGDLITANTLKADRLLLRGEDGLYFAINTDEIGRPLDPDDPEDAKYLEGIDGSAIVAHSITADEITTDNIQGINGWINFHSGTFQFINYDTVDQQLINGIAWDGHELTIKADTLIFGDINVGSKFEDTDSLLAALSADVYGQNIVNYKYDSQDPSSSSFDPSLVDIQDTSAFSVKVNGEDGTYTFIYDNSKWNVSGPLLLSYIGSEDVTPHSSVPEEYVSIDKNGFLNQVQSSQGTYTFTYSNNNWHLNDSVVDISDYGLDVDTTQRALVNNDTMIFSVSEYSDTDVNLDDYGITLDSSITPISGNKMIFDYSNVSGIQNTANRLDSDLADLDREMSYLQEQSESFVSNSEYESQQQATTALQKEYDQLRQDFNTEQLNRQQRIQFSANNGLTISDGNPNGLQTQFTNSEIDFYDGAALVAYINGQMMYINNAQILESLRFGDFAFIPRGSGNVGFKWVGEDVDQSS